MFSLVLSPFFLKFVLLSGHSDKKLLQQYIYLLLEHTQNAFPP